MPASTHYRTGRQPREFDPSIPHMSSLRLMRAVKGAAPVAVPDVLNNMSNLPPYIGMMLNGPDPSNSTLPILGDCTIAGAHHTPQILDSVTGNLMVTASNDNIIDDYSDACGYVRGNPATDNGGVEQQVLKYWMQNGMRRSDGTRDKLAGYVEIDPRNFDDICRAIAECGVVYFGANVPNAWCQVSNADDLWDVAEPDGEGHCFLGGGYDKVNGIIRTTSWGINSLRMTKAGWLKYGDECYGLISENWILKTGKTPLGMNLADWQSAMQAIAA